jgi:hypothetical protein
MVLKSDAEIRCDKMAEALVNTDIKGFWKISFKPKKTSYPSRVDNVEGKVEITNLFADKVFNLYNSVSYNVADMDVLKNDIDDLINAQCTESINCTHGTHSIIANEVLSAIKKLKHGKTDGGSEVVSDHIINSCHSLSVHVSILFTAMLRHGLTPDGMLSGTMIPIPKGQWANLSSSDNFRAITLSSILCKLLDVIILIKEEHTLCTSYLQFGFKQGSSTSLCTSMVQETISCYIHNGSNIYGLMLHASKPFDRVNYCKLFRMLLEGKGNPYIVDNYVICI